MQTHNSKNAKGTKRLLASLTTWLLLVALLVQSLPLTVAAAFMPTRKPGISGSNGGVINGISSGIGKLESDEAIAQLKKDLLHTLNQDLVKKIEDQKLTGSVGVILSFSDNSLVTAYNKSSSKQTLGEYLDSYAASELKAQLEENQTAVLDVLLDRGLITEVKYNYYNVMDGAYVSTTYEQIEEISKIEGVERVIVSNTYEAAVAVENPVYVYGQAEGFLKNTQPEQVVDNGFAVQRRYEALQADGSWKPTAEFRVGDVVRVTLSAESTSGERNLSYVVLEDRLPSTFEAVDPELVSQAMPEGVSLDAARQWWNFTAVSHREFLKDRVRVFVDNWSNRSKLEVSYVARAVRSGEVTAPAAKAELMCRPEVHGLSIPQELEVDAR